MKSNKRGLFKHMGMMGMCCLLPIIMMAVLPFISTKVGAAGSGVIALIAQLICPIMMGMMMFGIFKGEGHSCCSDKDKKDIKESNL